MVRRRDAMLRSVKVPVEFDNFLVEKKQEKREIIGVKNVSKADIMRDLAKAKNNLFFDRKKLKFIWGWK